MADRVLPEEMILCILIRLPVKSILRCKSVCKPWYNLLSSPEFMQMHFHQFPGDPKSQDFIICRTFNQTVSLFNTECNGEKHRNLNVDDLWLYQTRIVGCCKGLVCVCQNPYGEFFIWNPALNLFKYIGPSRVSFGALSWASVGFGYDADVGDFKVVRVVCLKGEDRRVAVEVYSTKLESWQTIKVDFPFLLVQYTNDVIVNGDPHWRAELVHGEKCLLRFDVKKLVFKIVPMLEHVKLRSCFQPRPVFVDWKGSLAAIGYICENARVESIYIWVFDEGEIVWRLDHTFRPSDMKVGKNMTCPDNGKFIGNGGDGKLVVFDFETECVKVIEIDEARTLPLKLYGYSESLVYIKGMKPVVVIKGGKKQV